MPTFNNLNITHMQLQTIHGGIVTASALKYNFRMKKTSGFIADLK